jgi:hypothetical protein
MCHIYRSSDLHDIMIKRDSITDNALLETMIQDICELHSINSIMILTIAYDEINWIYILPLVLEICELEIEFF